MSESEEELGSEESDKEMGDGVEEIDEPGVARKVLQDNVSVIGKCLHAFWSANEKRLKSALKAGKRI
jgi:hypothetical protein